MPDKSRPDRDPKLWPGRDMVTKKIPPPEPDHLSHSNSFSKAEIVAPMSRTGWKKKGGSPRSESRAKAEISMAAARIIDSGQSNFA
jgi:hypothetical protein